MKNGSLPLWERIIHELASVLDAHGVCAGVAYEIARYTGQFALVGISDPQQDHFDVWICDGQGSMKQTRWSQEKASFDRVIEAGEVIQQHKFDLSPKELIHSELWQLPQESILMAPIPFPGEHRWNTTPGAIALIDPTPDCPLDKDTIVSLATQVTVLLDRAFLNRRSVQQTVEFNIIRDISYSITSTLNLEEIFRQVADAVRRTLGAESISIGLTDPASNEIIFVEALMGPLFQSLPPIRLKAGQGIAGWVATHGEPVIVNDVYADTRFFANADKASGFQTHSILCVPLQVEQRVIGVLEAINKLNGHFNDNDLRLLQAMSGQLAVAIENARLHTDVLAEKRRIETIFASLSEGLLTVNGEGWITAANDALSTLLRQDGDLQGRQALEIIKTRQGNFADFVEQVVQAKSEFPQLACDLYQGDDEYVPVLVSGTTIEDADGQVDEIILVFSDLRMIREVERMRDDFFHNIIHELRTPLATILMYARLLREGKAKDDPGKADRFLGVIERESDRLQKMVRQMLELAKMEAREIQRSMEPVWLNELFEQMLPPLADQATEKGLSFRQRVQTSLPAVVGHEDTLYLIFKNLIENGIKFTPSGTVRVEVRAENELISITVADEGIGIPEQAIPNLGKRFYRAQTAVERGIAGTGLGLYMVKEGIEKHNGTIEVSSVKGKGTTFIVRLPVAPFPVLEPARGQHE